MIEKLVKRMGTTRDFPQTSRVNGRSAGQTWTRPAWARLRLSETWVLGG